MNKPRKRACILILGGIIVPLFLLPFLSGYKAGAGWFSNLMHVRIAFGPSFGVPYRFVLGVAIFFIFLGIRRLDLMRSEK